MNELTFPKELGKKACVTSGYALPRLAQAFTWPQQKFFRRLFIKNLASCKPSKGRIRGDACPVLEGHGRFESP
ncbi:MAG: hypothetical protein COS97_02160 [Candidatus Nealsonbacteria bacterium CG07_land_8_20_14_0_80_40_10]|nr:MAG: hypothetical protein COU44_03355 [Candidatus Nealsonbacteria bacterium CG10_big_fil_rev_8_21_14_0_10_40_24]PIU43222.1 MAG: hypothetical protein COS97_02160 [Candidatus Nealsonbacteria bacterium CG07_land_8_20_14_0_80_40_10]